MSEVIRAECPAKFLAILPFHCELVENLGKDDNGNTNVIIEFEAEDLQPKEGLRICADLYGQNVQALMLHDGSRTLKSWSLIRQVEKDPQTQQPKLVMGAIYSDLQPPRKINAPMREQSKKDKPLDKMNHAELNAELAKLEITVTEDASKADKVAAIQEAQKKNGTE